MGDGGDGGDSGGDANNPATSNYDPTAPVSAPSGGDSGTTTAAPADDASAPFAPVFQWVQVAGRWVQQAVNNLEAGIPGTSQFALANPPGSMGTDPNAQPGDPGGGLPNPFQGLGLPNFPDLGTALEIALGVVAIIVLGVLVFRFAPAKKAVS